MSAAAGQWFVAGGRTMTVRRVVANIATGDISRARAFYTDVLDMDVVMDHGWIVTFASRATAPAQVSIASAGGSGQPVPDLSIEVDNLDEVIARLAEANLVPEYGPVVEPWGVRRLFVRDPFGRLVNILTHI